MTVPLDPEPEQPAASGAVVPDRLRAATLQDVARLAGVSAKTVARAVNGEDNVSQATRDRVFQAANELRFRPNRLARELRQGATTRTVGLVVGGLDNPFYSALAAGVDRALRPRELGMVIASTDDDPEREVAVVKVMLERRVHALLLVPSSTDHGYLEHEQQLGTPIVFLDRPPTGLLADSVLFDDREGVREAVCSLADLGHRRIAALADNLDLHTARERSRAFLDACTASGVEPVLHSGVHDGAAARALTESLLDAPRPPTALLGLNNLISVGALDVLLRRRSSCAFVGYDDFALAEALDVSVVATDAAELGYRASHLALERFAHPAAPVRTVRLPTHLVHRGSGCRPPEAVRAVPG